MTGLTGRYEDHPTVRRMRERAREAAAADELPEPLDGEWLRRLCLDAGADDVGFVHVDHPDLAGERTYIDEPAGSQSTADDNTG